MHGMPADGYHLLKVALPGGKRRGVLTDVWSADHGVGVNGFTTIKVDKKNLWTMDLFFGYWYRSCG